MPVSMGNVYKPWCISTTECWVIINIAEKNQPKNSFLSIMHTTSCWGFFPPKETAPVCIIAVRACLAGHRGEVILYRTLLASDLSMHQRGGHPGRQNRKQRGWGRKERGPSKPMEVLRKHGISWWEHLGTTTVRASKIKDQIHRWRTRAERRLEKACPRGTWVCLQMDDHVLLGDYLPQSGPSVVVFALSFSTMGHPNTLQF